MASPAFDLSVDTLDAWCEKLLSCNPLTENEVMQLCAKVNNTQTNRGSFFFLSRASPLSLYANDASYDHITRPRKCWAASRTCSPCGAP